MLVADEEISAPVIRKIDLPTGSRADLDIDYGVLGSVGYIDYDRDTELLFIVDSNDPGYLAKTSTADSSTVEVMSRWEAPGTGTI